MNVGRSQSPNAFLENRIKDCPFTIHTILTDNGIPARLYFQRPLKALKNQSPYDTIIETYKPKPECFHCNPLQKIMGLNSLV